MRKDYLKKMRYTKKFYQLYSQEIWNLQQPAANSENEILGMYFCIFNGI